MNLDLYQWIGFSGRSYEFWIYDLDMIFSEMGAVFIYAKQLNETEFSMVYINQTNRMDMVAQNPLSERVIISFLPDTVHILKVPLLDERKVIMFDLLMKYNPEGNRRPV